MKTTYPSSLEMKRDTISALCLEAFRLAQQFEINRLMALKRKPMSVQQVMDILELHNGRVPGFEFGDHLSDLVKCGWIVKSPCHLDGDCYVGGLELPAAIKGV